MIKLEVTRHSKDEPKIVEVEEYNPADLNEKLNSSDLNTVLIGESIFSRIDVKGVERIEEEIS